MKASLLLWRACNQDSTHQHYCVIPNIHNFLRENFLKLSEICAPEFPTTQLLLLITMLYTQGSTPGWSQVSGDAAAG